MWGRKRRVEWRNWKCGLALENLQQLCNIARAIQKFAKTSMIIWFELSNCVNDIMFLYKAILQKKKTTSNYPSLCSSPLVPPAEEPFNCHQHKPLCLSENIDDPAPILIWQWGTYQTVLSLYTCAVTSSLVTFIELHGSVIIVIVTGVKSQDTTIIGECRTP